MMTLVLTAVPAGLRGDLTKWLLEISPGVFVGNVSSRIRDHIWGRVIAECRHGRALLVYTTNTEQKLAFESHNHNWVPTDFDGVMLMKRPTEPTNARPRTGWSAARAIQRSRNPSWASSLVDQSNKSLDNGDLRD